MKAVSCPSALVLAGLLSASIPGIAYAQQSYPNRPIRFITPYAPGGSTTVYARLIGQHFTERWGQNVVVDNRPGGNTVIGTETVARAAPDGYTIMLIASTHAILSSIIKTPYDPIRDFAPIAGIAVAPQVMVINSALAARTVQEMIALAKAKPGQLNFASSGAGGPTHIAGEMFNIQAGVKVQHVPYKGAGPAMTDVIAGHVQMFFSVPVNVVAHVKTGRLRAVAVTGEQRVGSLPDTPTFAESGLPGMNVQTWNGVLAPALTPRPIVEQLSKEIGVMLARPDVRARFEAFGAMPVYSNADQFAAMIKSEVATYQKVIKAANIRID